MIIVIQRTHLPCVIKIQFLFIFTYNRNNDNDVNWSDHYVNVMFELVAIFAFKIRFIEAVSYICLYTVHTK